MTIWSGPKSLVVEDTLTIFLEIKSPPPLSFTQKEGKRDPNKASRKKQREKKSPKCAVLTKLSFHMVEADAVKLHYSTTNLMVVRLTSALVAITL